MTRRLIAAIVFAAAAPVCAQQDVQQTIEATTASGDKVLLHPNGRWEYVNTAKAVEAKKIADKYPENQVCPPGSQGGFFGFGRCIQPGDKDYNRGTLNPGRR